MENGKGKREIHTCMHDTKVQEIIIPVNIAQREKPKEMCGKRVCGGSKQRISRVRKWLREGRKKEKR